MLQKISNDRIDTFFAPAKRIPAPRGFGTYGMKLLGENYLEGEVGFTSTPEAGTSFFIRLPETLL